MFTRFIKYDIIDIEKVKGIDMTYIKKEKYGLRTYKGVGLASAVLGSMVVIQNAHAETREVNLNGWLKLLTLVVR